MPTTLTKGLSAANAIKKCDIRQLVEVLLWSARREARRFPTGRRLEPRTYVERRNWPKIERS